MAAIERIVLFKFKDGTPAARGHELISESGLLRQRIDGMEAFTTGRHDGPDGLSQDFTHGFVIRFRDDAAREAFNNHPDHKGVVDQLGSILDKVLAFDLKA